MGRLKLKDRCMGHCCEDIALERSPKDLEEAYRKWEGGRGDELPASIADIYLLYPMLTFDKKNKHHPQKRDYHETVYHYTCKNFDTKTRLCTIYKIRPKMCRDYPGDGVEDFCDHPKCQWKEKRGRPLSELP